MINSKAFAELATQLEMRLREAVAIGLAEAAAMVAEEAKHLVGHEQSEWPSLAQSTIERKGSGDEPLLETGEMRDSIEFRVEGLTAVIGSDNEKAVAHEHGTGHVPPRPFLSTAALHKSPEIVELLAEKLKLALKEG
jgi:phage gpG-like protein